MKHVIVDDPIDNNAPNEKKINFWCSSIRERLTRFSSKKVIGSRVHQSEIKFKKSEQKTDVNIRAVRQENGLYVFEFKKPEESTWTRFVYYNSIHNEILSLESKNPFEYETFKKFNYQTCLRYNERQREQKKNKLEEQIINFK